MIYCVLNIVFCQNFAQTIMRQTEKILKQTNKQLWNKLYEVKEHVHSMVGWSLNWLNKDSNSLYQPEKEIKMFYLKISYSKNYDDIRIPWLHNKTFLKIRKTHNKTFMSIFLLYRWSLKTSAGVAGPKQLEPDWSTSVSRTGYFACVSLVLYRTRAPIIGPFRAWKPTFLKP